MAPGLEIRVKNQPLGLRISGSSLRIRLMHQAPQPEPKILLRPLTCPKQEQSSIRTRDVH